MPLTSRKPRPLVRDSNSFRDDRLFIVASDDTYAPKQYFDAYELPRVKVEVVPTIDGTSSAPHVLARLEAYEVEDDDERWMLLDTDHYVEDSHAATFLQAISQARQKGINVAISRPCFDFWLLLHHLDDRSKLNAITNAKSVLAELRSTLGEFNKTNLDPKLFPLSSVIKACRLARDIDEQTGGGDRPIGPTSRVYMLWESIVSKAQQSQLPEELVPLSRAARQGS